MPFPYDLSVTTLFSFQKEKHQRMGELFSRRGLQNIKNRRVVLHALVYKPDIEAFSKLRFPCEVRVHLFDRNNCSFKQYAFFGSSLPSLCGEAPWHMQVDDDSFTDVDGLLDGLDMYYDYQDRVYLTAFDMFDLPSPLMLLAQEMGYGHIANGHKVQKDAFSRFTRFVHEWEASVRSDACIRSMAANPAALEYIRRAAEVDTFSDMAMAFAAAMCRVPAAPSVLLSHSNAWSDFTLNGGHLAHIHYVNESTDRQASEADALAAAFRKNFVGRPLSFGGRLGMKGMSVFTKTFTLSPDGVVTGYSNSNERSWTLEGLVLRVFGDRGRLTGKYKLTDKQVADGMLTGVYCSDLSYTNLFLSTDVS